MSLNVIQVYRDTFNPLALRGNCFRILRWRPWGEQCIIRREVMKEPDPGAESDVQSLGVDFLTLETTDTMSVMLAISAWERENIPTARSRLGIDFFLTLARLGVTPDRRGIVSLKKVYLTLPFSEKGMRQHIRRMEVNGLLAVW